MADDLSLLVKFRGDNSGLKATTADTRLAVSQLRHSFGTELTGAMQTLSASASALQGPMGGVASRISALTSVAGGAAGPLAIMAIGVTAITAAAYGTITALLSLAKSAADFAGEIFDLSQKTNFSAETLSALGVAAKFSGSTLESLSPSLVIFQKNMEKAADGQKEMSRLFKSLNIDTRDNEKALTQAFKALSEFGGGSRQTAVAMQLFGRSGKDVLGIIKETNGDLDAAKKKYAEMGLIIKSEAGAAADQFGDTLEALTMQFDALGRTIGLDVLPVLTVFMQDISRALTGSADNWTSWADVVKTEVTGALAVLEGFAIYVASMGQLSPETAFNAALDSLIQRSEQAKTVAGVIAATSRAAGSGGGGVGGGGGAKKKDTFLQDAEREAALAQKETLQLIAENVAENERALQEQARDIEEFTKRAIQLSNDRLNATIDHVNAENKAYEEALAKKLITQKEYAIKDRELTLETKAAVQKNEEEKQKLERDQALKISEAEIAAKQRELKMIEEADSRLIAQIKRRVDLKLITESEGEKQIAVIEQEAFERRKKALELEEVAYATTLERRTAITDELVRLEGERAGAAVDASQRIVDALNREAKAAFDKQNAAASGATRPRRVNEAIPMDTDAFSMFRQAIKDNLGGDEQTAAIAGLEAMASAFQQVGQAVGEAVHSFVLFGTAGTGIKKFTATLIAEIARMAAVQAVWELAQGLAMLAMNFFWPDPKLAASAAAHFHAAAIYGALAVGAAVVGRGVAGNSFSQGAGGGASSGGGGGATGATSTAPQNFDVGRRKTESLAHVLEFKVKGDAVIDHFERDYMLNGRTRLIIRSDGGS